MPQICIIGTIGWAEKGSCLSKSLIGGKSYILVPTFSHEYFYSTGDITEGHLFVCTLFLSTLTASIGIAKFLKSGPASIVRSEKCKDGYGTLTFILIFLNVFATLTGKIIVIGNFGFRISIAGSKNSYLLILIIFAPHILYVCRTYFIGII